jgi:transcriptional regulator with XRE-family HTH domain
VSDPSERWAAVGEWVQARMLRKGWNQKQLCEASGLSAETVRPFHKGTPATRDPASAARIAIALGEPGDTIKRILDGTYVELDEPASEDASVEARLSALEDQMRELLEMQREADRR